MPHFLANIKQEMERTGLAYKIVACTDASTDTTAEIIEAHKNTMPIELLEQRKERGLGVAFRHSLDAICEISDNAEDIVIFLDADCTHDLRYSAKLIEAIQEGNDIVIASRFAENSTVLKFPLHRMLISKAASIFFQLLFPIEGVKDYTSGYRAYSITILKKAKNYYKDRLIEERDFCCLPELLIKMRKVNAVVKEVSFAYNYGLKIGESKMNIVSLIIATFRMSVRLLFCCKLDRVLIKEGRK